MKNPPFDSRILPGVTWAHLQATSIDRLRDEAVARNPAHFWGGLTNEALALAAGLVVPDEHGELTVTVAGLLLLGTREAVRTFLPSHRTQAVFRPGNWKRGNREELRANLFETFDALLAFAARQLPEELAAPAAERWTNPATNPRDAILSEIFAHSLATRDYAKPYPARFVIEADRVFMEHGVAASESEQDTDPNPLLTSVFREIGRAVKPGAEDSIVAHWGKAYFGMRPMIVKSTVYRILAPFPRKPLPVSESKPAWDITEMLATQAPWVHSKAAQAEVAINQNALRDLMNPNETGSTTNLPAGARTPFVSPAVGHPVPQFAPPFVPVSDSQTAPVRLSGPPAATTADRVEKILEFCRTPRYRSEVQAHIGIVNRDYFRKDILNPLIEKGLLQPTLPDKPNSPNQQYCTVPQHVPV